MDGFEATRRWLEDASLAEVPIIAMTANAMHEDRERAFATGMRDFVAKPIDPPRLHATVARWVGARGRERTRDVATSSGTVAPPSALTPVTEGDLPGVDAAAALARLGGNRSLLVRLLVRFRESEGDCVERIERALAAGDRPSAVRAAHTLKGLAATLGAGAVSRRAAEVEDALGKSTPHAASLVRLRAALDVVTGGLAHLDDEAAAPPPASTAAPERLDADSRAALEHASELLASYDTAANRALAALEGRVPAALRGLLTQARARASDFEFDEAREHVLAALAHVDASA